MDLQTKVMYGQAELINYRKRCDERIEDLLKYKNEDLLLDLTDMIENLDRASKVKAETEEAKKIQTGIAMVNNQFKEILKKYGVVEIEAIGYPFDPNYMEAMMVENDDTKPDEMVLDVLRKGYKYKDRVLKHAMVKVNKNENTKTEDKKGNE
jgi:molecular chaperone GrpE